MYWYTRTSVVGIDVWATACLALAGLLHIICPPAFDKDGPFSTASGPLRAMYGIIGVWLALPAMLMLRTILPYHVIWTTWTNLEIRRAQSTHRERASKRVANQLLPSMRVMVSRFRAGGILPSLIPTSSIDDSRVISKPISYVAFPLESLCCFADCLERFSQGREARNGAI